MPMLNKILYAEDDLDIHTITMLSLDQDKYQIETCFSGDEAVKKASEFKPDLAILDVMMPRMDGVTAFRELRSKAETKDIPVIFMTAKVSQQEIKSYNESGAIGVIQKPFDPVTLQSEIESLYTQSICSHSENNAKDETSDIASCNRHGILKKYLLTLPEKIQTLETAYTNLSQIRTCHEISALAHLIRNINDSAQTYGLKTAAEHARNLESFFSHLLSVNNITDDDLIVIDKFVAAVIESLKVEYRKYILGGE